VEFTPSWLLPYKSNFTATLFPIPKPPGVFEPYPKLPPKFPRTVVLFPCIVKVKPSAVGLVPPEIRKVKSVVKL
jgi:hypothetical protein